SSASSDCSSDPSTYLESVLLEHKQFLAARIIQCHVRGWLFRSIFRKQNEAATTISRWWRGYWVRSHRFAAIEALLQERQVKYYHDVATKAQSLFRGWQTRMKCQDFQAMKQLRMQCAEDMLSTLAKVLHKMRQDRLLPGIYGLRGSLLLSKIEVLSITFGYRFHNGRMRAAIAQRRALLAKRRQEFRNSMLYTEAPFPGPDAALTQQPEFSLSKRIGTQQQRVFLLYDKCNRDRHVKNILLKASARLRDTMAAHREALRSHFCKELIRRTIRSTLNLPSTRRYSGMIQQFIDDLLMKVEEFNCYCKPMVDNNWCV
ncbi:hypothetical protein KR200_008473, partial [Drosophila serrata]